MDRSLVTLLRSLHSSPNPQDAARLLPIAIGLLLRLSNPLNVTLLVSQLLSSGVLYSDPQLLSQSISIFRTFYTAALRFGEDSNQKTLDEDRSDLDTSAWLTAVVQGADEKSPRWRHTLLLGGLLSALHADKSGKFQPHLRLKLENALVAASNIAMHQEGPTSPSNACVIFVLVQCFHLLASSRQTQLDYDILLPRLIETIFLSQEGFQQGYWLGAIDADVQATSDQKFHWSRDSLSFQRLNQMRTAPLNSSIRTAAFLMATSIEHVKNGFTIMQTIKEAAQFSHNLIVAWRQNKLSEIHPLEEEQYLDQDTITIFQNTLLPMLRDIMLAMVLVLRAAMGRVLCDRVLARSGHVIVAANGCMSALHDMYFLTHRFGLVSSPQYGFVNYSAIDVLNQYPQEAQNFLSSIRSATGREISQHPLDRLHDLFFLNTAEHFTFILPASVNEQLVLQSALPYINAQSDPRSAENFEAAHSVMLAVISAPQNSEIAVHNVLSYVETLLSSFPQMLNARQFRLAVKSIVRLAAPPSSVFILMPLFQGIVLEMIRERYLQASENILPPSSEFLAASEPPVSEKAVLLLTMIDCLCFLSLPLLDEFLSVTAELLFTVENPAQRSLCQKRLWQTLSNGEMDVDRATLCVIWWNNRGGREAVLYGEQLHEREFVMSGAVEQDSKL